MLKRNYSKGEITEKAKKLFQEERKITRLDGWFITKELEAKTQEKYQQYSKEVQKAYLLKETVSNIPLSINEYAIFAGTQRDAFARSYALINPSFKVEEFSGYCDPTAVFSDIEPNDEFTKERIEQVKRETQNTSFVKELTQVYSEAENYTSEVIFFVEQVTGHLIPDFRYALKYGIGKMIAELDEKDGDIYEAMKISVSCVDVLAKRYIQIAAEQKKNVSRERAEELDDMIETLSNVRTKGAENLYEAIQLFMLMWQIMCLEQAPNPYAFSVGNADRMFEPYRKEMSREEAAELFKHFLVFFNVADRSWAISQNILISGKNAKGEDLTNTTTYALLDAYYDMNLPQPILSVKFHKNTPDELYKELGKFFFSPGMLTPSLFNDDALFEVLRQSGVEEEDLADYAVAGCQEPLIMGKDNGNTTNSWLNLPKVMELIISGGYSTVTGKKLMDIEKCNLHNIRSVFYDTLDKVCDEMVKAANGASCALSNLRVPFLSAFMGGMEYGADVRDTKKQGSKYNGSGCLVHGLTVVADSFIAIDRYLEKYPDGEEGLVQALLHDFKGYEEIHKFLKDCPKFGNNIQCVDDEACEIADKVCAILKSKKNYLGNSFRPDFSSPSTHLLYGYWVGATPDGRSSRDMLGYGVDPLYGEAGNGLGFRMLSNMKLPFDKFNGGYASHLGIDPKYFTGKTPDKKGMEFKNKIIEPLFFNELNNKISPFYLYVNVTTPEILRKVLEDPKKYAPSGVYIVRIHGTFVNFLDLSPAIQRDIITRLDQNSTKMG